MHIPRIAIPVPTSSDLEYNRRSWPPYAEAVSRSGGDPVEVPLNQLPGSTARLIASCHGILLPGSGADVNPQKYGQESQPECNPPDPARENVDELLLQEAHNMRKPLLAICFGTQMLNVWRGGTLVQHLPGFPVNHRAGRAVSLAHSALIAAESVVGRIAAGQQDAAQDGEFIRLPINSSHHQAIGIVGDGLKVIARCPEDGVVEGIEGADVSRGGAFVIGVQWHPERTFEESAVSRAIFRRLIDEAAAWSPKKVQRSA